MGGREGGKGGSLEDGNHKVRRGYIVEVKRGGTEGGISR